jgi:hypothetical protein
MTQIRPQTRLFQPSLLDFFAAERFIGYLGRDKRIVADWVAKFPEKKADLQRSFQPPPAATTIAWRF